MGQNHAKRSAQADSGKRCKLGSCAISLSGTFPYLWLSFHRLKLALTKIVTNYGLKTLVAEQRARRNNGSSWSAMQSQRLNGVFPGWAFFTALAQFVRCVLNERLNGVFPGWAFFTALAQFVRCVLNERMAFFLRHLVTSQPACLTTNGNDRRPQGATLPTRIFRRLKSALKKASPTTG